MLCRFLVLQLAIALGVGFVMYQLLTAEAEEDVEIEIELAEFEPALEALGNNGGSETNTVDPNNPC